ncbi:MAG: helix-turn-helix domain-containing protein [Oscillospiraceae bacterium]|nr:helix-turn-helix domain-containing protein [Oscillospiraceae bacterium]
MNRKTVGKIISSQRQKCKMSLSDLCAGICNKSTLMRIEAGEMNANTDILSRLLERLGTHVDFDDESNFDDVLVRQIIRNANQADVTGCREEAHRLLDTIAGSYDSFSLQNRQRYDVLDTMLLYKDGRISAETRLRNLEMSMRLTQPNYSRENLPLVMTDMEAQILRYIATTYGILEDYESAIMFYSHLKNYIENDLDKVGSAKKLASICYNLSKSLGLVGRYDESIAIAEESIKYSEFINDIRVLPSCIYNCARVLAYRNNNGDKSKAKELVEEALSLRTPRTWNIEELSELLEKLRDELNNQ